MLWIVHNPSHRAKHRGESRCSKQQKCCKCLQNSLHKLFSLPVEWFPCGCEAAVRANRRAWRASSPLQDCCSGSRRRRERLDETQNFERARQLPWPQHFINRNNKTRGRQNECAGHQGGSRRVFATRHRARFHTAHVVPAIHGSRVLRGSWLRLVVMMLGDVAKASRATVHAIRQQRSTCHRRIQNRYRQQTKPCSRRSNAMLSFRTHKNPIPHPIPPNDTPLRRLVEPWGSQILRTESMARSLSQLATNYVRTAVPLPS